MTARDTLATFDGAMKAFYMPIVNADLSGHLVAFLAGSHAKHEHAASMRCYRRARWLGIGRRRRAAYLGWARRHRREAARLREVHRRNEKDTPLIVTWPQQ